MLNSREMQHGLIPELQSALFFETPDEIYQRVFRELKPRTPVPPVRVEYRRFANADSSIRLENGALHVRISDILEGAPAPVTESLARILLGKLLRKPIPRAYSHRYRLYLNRKDIRRQMHVVRQLRGRKYLSGPQGKIHNLEPLFEGLNCQFFDGLLGQPNLGWSLRRSRSMLGHFDPSHNAIIISRIFDEPAVPVLALEYVMYHEMLHLRFPVDHSGTRRCVHTREFREAEKKFPRLAEAKQALRNL
jgi:hypothetical protein